MNPPPGFPNNNLKLSEELKNYLLVKQDKGPLYSFLFTSTITLLVLLVSVLKPHRLYKKFIVLISGIDVKIGNYKYKLHHFLILILGFYGTIFFFIQMQRREVYPNNLDPYKIKMAKLDKKWIIDAQSWLAFLCIICILCLYKNAKLFNSEECLNKKLKEYDEELKKKK